MTPEAAEQALFDEVLAADERLPVAFLVTGLDARDRLRAWERAEVLLRGLALAEEARRDEGDDPAAEPRLQRVEAKLDLMIGLLAGVLARDAGLPPARPLHWSWRGMRVADLDAQPGQIGLLRVQISAWLPQLLELPAEVIASGEHAGRPSAWLRFDPSAGGVETALERHLFRMHRRAIADARRLEEAAPAPERS